MDKIHQPEGIKPFLHAKCMEMIKELQDSQTQLMEIYRNNPTYPFDFYNLSLRETDTKILTIREFYKRIIEEDL